MWFDRWVVGTQLLAKVRGWKCHWPVVVWSARLCLRKDMSQLLESHKHGALPASSSHSLCTPTLCPCSTSYGEVTLPMRPHIVPMQDPCEREDFG